MADFSKQYCDKYDPEFPWDFDIEEIAKDLDEDKAVSIICEGFGSSYIGKNEHGDIVLGFRDYTLNRIDERVKWVPLKDVTDKTHRIIWETDEK